MRQCSVWLGEEGGAGEVWRGSGTMFGLSDWGSRPGAAQRTGEERLATALRCIVPQCHGIPGKLPGAAR